MLHIDWRWQLLSDSSLSFTVLGSTLKEVPKEYKHIDRYKLPKTMYISYIRKLCILAIFVLSKKLKSRTSRALGAPFYRLAVGLPVSAGEQLWRFGPVTGRHARNKNIETRNLELRLSKRYSPDNKASLKDTMLYRLLCISWHFLHPPAGYRPAYDMNHLKKGVRKWKPWSCLLKGLVKVS